MKTLFIEAKSKLGKVDFSTRGLPSKVGIVTTIQYLSQMKKVVDFLWKKDIKAVIAGQILGCDAGAAMNVKKEVDAFLYIGTGQFHPIGVALRTLKPVFVLHPVSMKIDKLDQKKIDAILRKRKGMLLKFYTSDKIGVLMTTKEGQSRAQEGSVSALEKKYPKKTFYRFICDTLDFRELENFPFINCWVNTMCPRIEEDIKVLNIEDLK